MNPPRVLVIGSSNCDLTIYCERLPRPGETLLGGKFASNIGGKGANQAVAAKRMGAEVTFFSAVGNDSFGQAIREQLAQEGVPCLWVPVPDGTATGVALILVDKQGQNSIVVAPGANAAISLEDLDAIPFSDFGDVLLSLELPLEVVSQAASLAKRAGCHVSLNPAPAALLPESLLRNLDFLLPNEHELLHLLTPPASTYEEIAGRLRSQGVKTVIITLGALGANLMDASGSQTILGYAVNAIDTVGAGDCFCGALVAMRSAGRGLPESLRIANKAASLSVQRAGAIPSFPFLSEVLSVENPEIMLMEKEG